MPKLPTNILNCCFYLYSSVEDARAGTGYGGTGFFVSIPSTIRPNNAAYIYAVSNWHVVCQGGFSVFRVNRDDGPPEIFDFGPEEWQFIPGADDVAAAPVILDVDHHEFMIIQTSVFATQEVVTEREIGIGDDVFMIGRFVDFDGGERNIPSVRFGNISMMPEGNIKQPTGYMGPSYCIDVHSRTGYSGSPVFMYRTPGTDLTSNSIKLNERMMYFLGIHWGQFPELWEIKNREPPKKPASKQSLITEGAYVKGLSGMSCVIPAWKVLELLNIDRFVKLRATSEAALREKYQDDVSTPDAELAPSTTVDNPSHKEDFNSLLASVAPKKTPADQT